MFESLIVKLNWTDILALFLEKWMMAVLATVFHKKTIHLWNGLNSWLQKIFEKSSHIANTLMWLSLSQQSEETQSRGFTS